MRHAVAGYKLNRDSEHRRAMFRNMAIALFTHGQITTTHTKAKAVQPLVEKLITLAKKGDLASRRRVTSYIGNTILVKEPIDWDSPPGKAEGYRVNRNREKLLHGPRVVSKLFSEIGPRYADRPGGCTRIVKLGRHRIGDAADLVVLQLVGEEETGAPTMRGRYSRRRQKQDNRTSFAARLRKGGKKERSEEPTKAEKEPQPPAESPAASTE
jgi:large subunit ribosomal protein L17